MDALSQKMCFNGKVDPMTSEVDMDTLIYWPSDVHLNQVQKFAPAAREQAAKARGMS